MVLLPKGKSFFLSAFKAFFIYGNCSFNIPFSDFFFFFFSCMFGCLQKNYSDCFALKVHRTIRCDMNLNQMTDMGSGERSCARSVSVHPVCEAERWLRDWSNTGSGFLEQLVWLKPWWVIYIREKRDEFRSRARDGGRQSSWDLTRHPEVSHTESFW